MNDDFVSEWAAFSHFLMHRNRYFCRMPIVDKIISYAQNEENIEYLSTTSETFRARIIPRMDNGLFRLTTSIRINKSNLNPISKTDDFLNDFCEKFKSKFDDSDKIRINNMQKGYFGYDEKDSSAPPAYLVKSHGRANPDYISYLYLAEDAKTAISEIKPNSEDWISVGLFHPVKELKMARLYCNKDDTRKLPLTDNEELALQLSVVYSSVVRSTDFFRILCNAICFGTNQNDGV